MTDEQVALPIDKIRAHKSATRRTVIVDEWDLTLYFECVTTRDVQSVQARQPADTTEFNVLLLIEKAKLEDGTPAFRYGDKETLLREADVGVLRKVIEGMYGIQAPPEIPGAATLTEEELVGNFASTVGSVSD